MTDFKKFCSFKIEARAFPETAKDKSSSMSGLFELEISKAVISFEIEAGPTPDKIFLQTRSQDTRSRGLTRIFRTARTSLISLRS